MTDKQRENCRILAAFLRELPRDHFDIGSWVGGDWKGKADLSCGTTACAAGWATTIPHFRDQGLRLDWRHDLILKRPHHPWDVYFSDAAIRRLFGVEALHCFYPTWYYHHHIHDIYRDHHDIYPEDVADRLSVVADQAKDGDFGLKEGWIHGSITDAPDYIS